MNLSAGFHHGRYAAINVSADGLFPPVTPVAAEALPAWSDAQAAGQSVRAAL
jgi:hypothetical protein